MHTLLMAYWIYTCAIAISVACLGMYFYGAWHYLLPVMMPCKRLSMKVLVMIGWLLVSPVFLLLIIVYHGICGYPDKFEEWADQC